MTTLLLLWLFGGLLGYAAATKRGWSPLAGFVGGVLLGPLAFLLFFVSGVTGDDKRQKCPRCAEWIKAEATICKHCGGTLKGQTT